MKIVIDPGHSGPMEPGACAAGIHECDVVLAIAKLLADHLCEAGHEIWLTRTGDIETDDLSFRAKIAKENRADVFVSIHANSAVNIAARGTETYYYPSSVEGQRLAECIQARLVAALDTADRGVKEARFQVLRETNCPAVLIEVAFISSDTDRQLLTAYAYQLTSALAIVAGLEDYTNKGN